MELERREERLAAVIESKLELGIHSLSHKVSSSARFGGIELSLLIVSKEVELNAGVSRGNQISVQLKDVEVIVVDTADFHSIGDSSTSSAQVDGTLFPTGLANFPLRMSFLLTPVLTHLGVVGAGGSHGAHSEQGACKVGVHSSKLK